MCFSATTMCTFSTSQLQKVLRSWCVLYILTWKCASRIFATQQGPLFRHLNFQKWSETVSFLTLLTSKRLRATTACTFFGITTSKSAPILVCFVHVDEEMCLAAKRNALFRHHNFQKCSDPWCALYMLTRKCASRQNGMHCFDCFDISTCKSAPRMVWFVHFVVASRHNGVQFFISHLARWLRTRRFSEPTFRPSRSPKSLEKRSVSRLSYLFGHLDLLSSEIFSFWSCFFFSSFSSRLVSSRLVSSRLVSSRLVSSLLFSSLLFSSLLFSSLLFSSLLFSSLLFSSLLFSSLLFSSLPSLLFSSLTLTTSAFHLSILSEVWLLNFLRWMEYQRGYSQYQWKIIEMKYERNIMGI